MLNEEQSPLSIQPLGPDKRTLDSKVCLFFFLTMPICLIKNFHCPCKPFFFYHYSCTAPQKAVLSFFHSLHTRCSVQIEKNYTPGVYMLQCMPQIGGKGKNELYECLCLYSSCWLWFITSRNQHNSGTDTVFVYLHLYGIVDAQGWHRYE